MATKTNVTVPLRLERTMEVLLARWATFGLDVRAPRINEKGTLVSRDVDETNLDLLSGIPHFSFVDGLFGSERHGTAELRMDRTIGRGGMGVVQLALQVPLHREVAVKRVAGANRGSRANLALLREAWITGMLEHPNIVPVHALGRDERGEPMFVMKRIEGVTWDVVMHDPSHSLRKNDAREHLEWNFDILQQVCNAVHFAHSKGIIHRDLKPENVMIGEFGEVYLVDWGISVSLRDDGELPLPRAHDCKSIVGTPAYMAPEMAAAETDAIDERTDVFQLGAIAHEIVTNTLRHQGDSLAQTLFNAVHSVPYAYDEGVPRELAALCNKATHVDPAHRFPSAERFKQAIRHFLHNRSSVALSREAERRLNEMRPLLEQSEANPQHEELRLQIYNLFTECRFGFQHALQIWEQNTRAHEGLRAATEVMFDYEIAQGDYKAAALLFSTLDIPDNVRKGRLDTLGLEVEAQRERQKQLEKLKRDSDLRSGRRSRSMIGMLLAVLYVPIILSFSKHIGIFDISYTAVFMLQGSFVLLLFVGSLRGYKDLSQTSTNRRFLLSFWCLAIAYVAHPLAAQSMEISPDIVVGHMPLLTFMYVATLACMLDIRLLWSAFIFLFCFLLTAVLPEYVFEIVAFSGFAGLSLIIYFIRTARRSRSRREGKRDRKR